MDGKTHAFIVSFIWGIADECLRDRYTRGKYRDVILPMTVIRRLDAQLERSKEAVLALKKKLDAAGIRESWPALYKAAGQAFCNVSPFRLRDLTSRARVQSLKADFTDYLDGFSPNVQEILDKFDFHQQIGKMADGGILGAVIEKFVSPDIDLSPERLDNHAMGTVFEELLRRFNEENNEEAGEHWTPRDVVELMADLAFRPVADRIKDGTYLCYDGACGTGGMLTVAQSRLQTLADETGKALAIHLFGQEINAETYAIAKADLLLKGDGAQAENIRFGSTLSHDGNRGRTFDFMLSNPPYGKNWKADREDVGDDDPRFVRALPDGTVVSMLPRVSDGQLLFLLNNVAKMKPAKDGALGSRIIEVHNGSSLFTGDAGGGESNARRYLIENDLVEAIIAVPENMFYNTGIGTYIWVLSNNKPANRRGKIQLIDATALKKSLRKNLGQKNCEFSPELREQIVQIFLSMEEGPLCRVLPNSDFGYWSVTVERPLRLRLLDDPKIPEGRLKPAEAEAVRAALARLKGETSTPSTPPRTDWAACAKALALKPTLLKKVRTFLTCRDPEAAPLNEPDPALRDTEIVPFDYPGGVDAFLLNEVRPYAPDAYLDPAKTQVGYEISFTKYFYKPAELRTLNDILADLRALDAQAASLMHAITEEA